MAQENRNIVIDNGSGVLKAGFSGSESGYPSIKFDAVYGTPKYGQMIGSGDKTEFIGDEAQKIKGVLNLKHPIKSGIVDDWEIMSKIWEYTFSNELRVDPSEHRVMLTEAPGCPRRNREKMTEVMFETFNVEGMYIAIQAVLSLYANGRTTGVVCDSGDGVTHTVPVFEGFQIPHAIQKNQIAGRVITKHFEDLLHREGQSMGTGSAWQEICRSIKEKVCYVALDFKGEQEKAKKSHDCNYNYELPSGDVITCNASRFEAPEALFNPNVIKQGDETPGMHQMVYNSIKECDIDVRRDLYNNIILSGGSTMYNGLADRLEAEVDKLAPAPGLVKIFAPADRYYAVWQGGAVLSSLATFEASWCTREEYADHGAEICHRKFV